LADEGRSVNANQFRKVTSIVSPEVEKDTLIRTYAQESTSDFDGQHFTVMQPWLRTVLTEFQVLTFKPIVNESKHCHDIYVSIYF
jgi:hypothetical protein